jgi:hypothetical protein
MWLNYNIVHVSVHLLYIKRLTKLADFHGPVMTFLTL